MNIHTLAGCSPTPLAHYLKALGILRLVAEQKDESVRGWWRDETFHLATKLSRDELEQFFLNEYQPTPLITPWNAGSGFYKNWDPKKATFRNSVAFSARVRLERSTAIRLEAYRRCIRVIGEVILEQSFAVDAAKLSKKELDAFLLIPPPDGGEARAINADEQKGNLIARVFQVIPSAHRAFFDSVFALISSPESKGIGQAHR